MLEIIEANAGAGKTTTIVRKYVELLKEVNPENIALITFTEAAAADLRDRVKKELEEATDPELKKKLIYIPSAPIGTIHSFCYDILKRFGFKYRFFSLDTVVATSLEVEKFLDEVVVNVIQEFQEKEEKLLEVVLRRINYDRPRAFNSLITFLKTLVKNRTRFLMFDDSFSVDRMMERIRELYSTIPSSTEVLVNLDSKDANENAKREREISNLLLRISKAVVRAYEKKLLEENRIDYSGILLQAFELVKNFDNAREEIAKAFRYIIIDEFQDTDPIQWGIVKALLKHDPEISVIVVGDPKQSIYRFRSADLLIWNEAKSVASKKEERLTNYRSARGLIDFFNSIFSEIYNELRGSFPGELEFRGFELSPETPEGGEVILYIYRPRKEKERFVKYAISKTLPYAEEGTVGIIGRRWNDLRPFERVLKENGIDYTYVATNPYNTLGVEELLHLLRWLANPEDKKSLFLLLSSRMFGLTHTEALKVVLTGEFPEELKEFQEICEETRKRIDRELHSVLILHLLTKLNYLDALYLTDFESYHSITEVVNEIYNFEKQEPLSFREIIWYIENMGKNRDYSLTSKVTVKKGYVLTTIHSSKGLEFDSVVVVPWKKSWNYGNFLYTNIGFAAKLYSIENLPEESPYFNMLKELDSYLDYLEEKNLLYVALTRAKKQLIVGVNPEGRKKFKIGSFVFDREKYEQYVDYGKEGKIYSFEEERDFRQSKLYEADYVKVVRPSSHDESFESERNPYIPSGISPGEYGTIVHALCQAFVNGADREKAVKFALSFSFVPSEELKKRLQEIYSLLEKEYNYLRENSEVEVPFELMKEGKIIRGRIDLVRYLPEGIEIWDFKTGLYSEEKVKIYQEQLRLYREAFKEAGKKVANLKLFFIDENRLVTVEEPGCK
ncbi:UvrD-helicase domain-containing protein [Desulfurobacterium crinifex]